MARREVEVGQRVGLGLLEYARGLRAAALQYLCGQVVGRPYGAGIPEAERGATILETRRNVRLEPARPSRGRA